MKRRTIEHRVSGSQHGFIRRMLSPGDLGARLKPFVFLDYLNGHVEPGSGFGFHPHSGIATLTYQLNADAAYEDTTGQNGIVRATGLEWMRSGGGTWHQGFIHPHTDFTEGFQLWLALPPGVEDGPPEGIYVAPEDVPQVGNVRVLLGEYGGARNPIPAASPIHYFDVVLSAGESFVQKAPADHDIAWAFVYRGKVLASGEPVSKELVIFDESDGELAFAASEPSRLLVGTAKKHDYPLLLGSHSVHTNQASLQRGIERIREVGQALRQAGRFSSSGAR